MVPRPTDLVQRAGTNATATAGALTGLLVLALFLPSFSFFATPQNYAALHLVMELLAIVVSLLVFAVGWNAFTDTRSADQIVLACGLLAVALLDLLHALSYQGMPDLASPSSPEKAIGFWLAARTVNCATLLAVALRKPAAIARGAALAVALVVVVSSAWIGLLHLDWLPRTYVAGAGLTGFKVAFEWTLVAGFSLAAFVFVRRARREARADYWWLGCASFTMALGEIFFSRYVAVSDVFNFLGHLYKIIAFAIIYRVVFVGGIHTPYLNARALERKFRASFDQAFQYMGLLSPDGRLLDVNQTAVNDAGVPLERFLGRLIFWEAPWWVPEQRPRIEDAVRRAARGETVRLEVTHFTKPGEIRHADLSIKPFFDDRRAVEMLIAEGRDITEQKSQADALRQSTERLRLAVFASGIGIFDHDARAGTQFWSEEMRLICGIPNDTPVSGESYRDLVHPDDRNLLRTALEKAQAADGSGVLEVEHRIVRPDGGLRWVALRGQVTLERDHAARAPARIVGVVLDITEARLREEAVRVSDNRLREAVGVAKFGIFDHDQVVDKIYWSPEQRANYGFDQDEEVTLAKFIVQVYEEDRERVGIAVQRAHDPSGDGRFDIEHRIIRRDGQVRWLSTRAQTFFDGEGAARRPVRTVGAVLDVTDRKHAEDQLRELNATLEQRVAERTEELERALHTLARAQDELVRTEKLAALGSLVAGVSHELNTPLGNALIVASTLRDKTNVFERDAGSNSLRRSQLDEYVSMAAKASELVMHNLTQAADLVASFKQVAVDQTSAKRRDFDLKETIEEVLSTVRVLAKNRPISVRADLVGGVRMDSYPGPLGQVITNLFNNALEHAFAGRDTGAITLRTQLAGEGRITLEFADDGAGIAAADLPKIFDPFFMTRLGQGGSGLGLNIVHNIVTGVLGGRISVDSARGQGTRFTLQLPIVAPRAADMPTAQAA